MPAPEDPTERLTRSAASAAVESIGWRHLLGTLQTSVPVSSLDQGVRVAAAAARACAGAADGRA